MTQKIMTNEEYQAAPGLSFTSLKQFAISPAHYWEYKENGSRTKSDPVFIAAHIAILEPERWPDAYVVVADRRTNVNKKKVAEAEAEGKMALRPNELETVEGMAQGVRNHKLANSLVTKGQNETSFFAEHELGFTMKCRPDVLWMEQGIFADVKGFFDLRDSMLRMQVRKQLYNWQSAWYQDVLEKATGQKFRPAHIFVEDKPPHGVRVKALQDASLDKARDEYYPLLPDFAECWKSGNWTKTYDTDVTDLSLPDNAWGER